MNKISNGLILNLNISIRNRCFIHTSRIFRDEVQPSKDVVKEQEMIRKDLNQLKVGIREKYMLVWGGKYKHLKDVPKFENQHVLEKARNKARVKINILMGIATLFGCMLMVYLGKRDVARGENVNTMYAKYRGEVKVFDSKEK